MAPGYRILPCGDAAFAVEYGDTIDPVLNNRVLALDAALQGVPGVTETVPTYRSVLVHYDPLLRDFDAMVAAVGPLAEEAEPREPAGRTWRIPVSYGGENGIDLEQTADARGMSPGELVERHSAPTYRVYMIGFLPGYAYLGGLDPAIATPRRTSPRLKTPAGTIAIGGIQAAVASIEAPSGWHLLGRTPVRNFMPGRDPVFILQPGDGVRFEPISAGRFVELDHAAEAGELVAELEPAS